MYIYGSLTWNSEPFSSSVNFLDLTITLNNGHITTSTFQKPMNLYIYIPPHSTHQPGMLKSLIFGQLQNYWKQNTHSEDYEKVATLLFTRLRDRGYDSNTLSSLFKEAARKIDSPSNSQSQPRNTQDLSKTLFIHEEFHPDRPHPSNIHHIFDQTCQSVIEALDLSTCVCYSKPKNLFETVSKTSFHNLPKNVKASDILA